MGGLRLAFVTKDVNRHSGSAWGWGGGGSFGDLGI